MTVVCLAGSDIDPGQAFRGCEKCCVIGRRTGVVVARAHDLIHICEFTTVALTDGPFFRSRNSAPPIRRCVGGMLHGRASNNKAPLTRIGQRGNRHYERYRRQNERRIEHFAIASPLMQINASHPGGGLPSILALRIDLLLGDRP
jgi:hypothetical protein